MSKTKEIITIEHTLKEVLKNLSDQGYNFGIRASEIKLDDKGEEFEIELAEKAEAENIASDEYQLAVLFSAVGLSQTGWASVISSPKLKLTFMGSSIVSLTQSVLKALSVG